MRKINNKLKQLKALQKHADGGLQCLVDGACRIFGKPLILYDIDFAILAYAEPVSNDAPFWNWFLDNGTIRQEIKDIYVSEGLSDIIINSKGPIFISNDKLRYNWIFGKIHDKHNMPIACVHVLSSNNSCVDDELEAVDALCKMLSIEMLKIPYFKNYTQRKFDACVTMLIERKAEDEKQKLYIAGYVEMLYMGLKDNLYLAVADISQCDPSYSKLTYYRDLLKQMRSAFKYSIYLNHIIIIMSTDEKVFYAKRCVGRLNKVFEQENIKVGISSRFENLFGLSRHYNEAVMALHSGLRANREQWIFVYDGVADGL